MATTVVPKYTEPIELGIEDVREELQGALEVYRGDEDKAGTIEDANYYEGAANAIESVLQWLVSTPRNLHQEINMAQKQTMDTIEKGLDTVVETAETLERIPTARLNGTTKQQQIIILGTTAGVSLVAGMALYRAFSRGAFAFRRRKNKKVIQEFAEGGTVKP